MRVRAKPTETLHIPPEIEPYARQRFITGGKEYDVHAVSMLGDHGPFLQFVDDIGYPAWLPSLVFDIIDVTIPGDWICNCAPMDGGGYVLLLGPDFVAQDVCSHTEMVELDADKVDRFWKRIDVMKQAEEDLEE